MFPSRNRSLPDAPPPAIYGPLKFGVEQRADPFRDQLPQSVALPLMAPPARPSWDGVSERTCYRPARLAFHPYTQVRGMLGTQYPFGPPPTFWIGFILPKNRSPSFKSYPGDCPPFQTAPLLTCWHVAFASTPRLKTLSLATKINSLASYPKPTMEPLTLRSLRAPSKCHQ